MRDLLHAQTTQREEILEMIARRRRKKSALKVRNEQILRLEKSGMKDQLKVAKLSSKIGGKITTDQYLDKGTLKKMLAKKSEKMFPDKKEAEKRKVTLLIEDAET